MDYGIARSERRAVQSQVAYKRTYHNGLIVVVIS